MRRDEEEVARLAATWAAAIVLGCALMIVVALTWAVVSWLIG